MVPLPGKPSPYTTSCQTTSRHAPLISFKCLLKCHLLWEIFPELICHSVFVHSFFLSTSIILADVTSLYIYSIHLSSWVGRLDLCLCELLLNPKYIEYCWHIIIAHETVLNILLNEVIGKEVLKCWSSNILKVNFLIFSFQKWILRKKI